MTQLELHKKIDKILTRNPNEVKMDEILELISVNFDAKNYFFAKADERWLDWLWDNGFLDAIKQKAEDPTRYGYRTPKINYLVRIAGKAPAKVVEIINDDEVATTEEKFNPEVIDQFLRICSSLPAKELAKVIPKIKKDGWVKLMAGFNQWGFEYEKMFKTLSEAKDYKNLLILAEAILEVRDKKEIAKKGSFTTFDNPFYFNDLSYTKVFEYLVAVSEEYLEKTMELVTKIMAEIVRLGSRAENSEVFPIQDIFYLFDFDFFSLELGNNRHHSDRENVKDLAATIKILVEKLIGDNCDKSELVDGVYQKYIQPLPDSRLMWRLRLFVLSLCPQVFKDELKKSFFRLFEVERYHEIISGTEYKRALQKGFSVLSNDDKRGYIKKVIEYFEKKDQEKESEKEDWHLRYGSEILSIIPRDEITPEEKQEAEKAGFKFISDYEPKPSIGMMRGGFVSPQGPISPEEFNKLPIADIAQKLKNEWSPGNLREKYKNDDFLRPRNAEGAGELLKNDIPKRFQDYIDNATLFFDREELDPHYTYSFLRGIQECIREDKVDFNDVNWDNLITLCVSIKNSGEDESFSDEKRGRDTFDAWLASWTAVHTVITDVIQELLNEKNSGIVIDFLQYRDQLFEIISYLLKFPDPTPEDEQIETAKSKTKSPGDSDYMVSDPYTMAINTVRGRAFQALALFIYQDGKKFDKDDNVKIDSDVKKLYENILKDENTRAIMFMFGHYLPSFYFRDKEWIRGLLPQIFPKDSEKKNLYIAAWEGYFVNNLYEEMFFDSDIQKLYERGLDLKETGYPQQKHFKDPDEGIAIHFALAFMHYKDFAFEHKLFKKLWKDKNIKRHVSFVSFLGRSFISGDNVKANELLEREPESKKRLENFWDWMLENYENTEPFKEFGLWINLDKNIFKPAWLAEHVKNTLEKTKGILGWDYGLIKSIVQLAKDAPEDTFVIANLYLLEGGVRGNNMRAPLYVDREWFEALQELYNNQITTKEKTKKLIDDLIREGGSTFWKLKEIITNTN